ncbi:hypothetical protein FLAN108750_04885 [Flavobacterium antarcticum]|uniref:hypothetical protein n=1 Tax=Flavobacterium antarcticum TaxID=271155 RepID=UPI0003B46313|nr:hypothetical protein [Flavobacterium antarcticum]
MTIQQLIDQQMDHFIGKLIAKEQLSHEKVIEVATHIGSYLIRSRHVQNKGIANEEIDVVLQSVFAFIHTNFKDQFHTDDFILIKESTLNLLRNPGFDQEIQDYFKPFYE